MDDVIQKILLEGDGEVLTALHEIGQKGSEALKSLTEAASGGAGTMEHLGNALGSIVGVVTTAVAGLAAFVEAQDELTQKTAFLAESMGTTADVINGLEEAFASAGVAASTFERFANRLAVSIAADWPAITEAVRTSATKQREAQEEIVSATLRVKTAQDKVKFEAAEDSQKMANAQLAVRSAVLGVESAELRLQAALGNPPDAAQRKMLEIAEAELGVKKARQAVVDAELAQAKAAAEIQNTQAQLANAAAEAQDRLAGAQEKAAKQALTDLPSIAKALKGIVDGNGAVANSVKLSEVSVQNLKRSFDLAASGTSGIKPDGIKLFNEWVLILSKNTDGLISRDQELGLVNSMVGRGMMTAGIAASELLDQIKLGPEHFAAYTSAAKLHVSTSAEGVESARKFKSALALLHEQVELTARDLAVMASPNLISFFQMLQASLTETDGLLNTFVHGIESIGTGIAAVITKFNELTAAADRALSLEAGTTAKTILIAILSLIGFIASAWVGWPTLLAGTVLALGSVATHMRSISEYIDDNRGKFAALIGVIVGLVALFAPWTAAIALVSLGLYEVYTHWNEIKAAMLDNAVTRWWEKLYDVIAKVKSLFTGGGWKNPATQEGTPENEAAKLQQAKQNERAGLAKAEQSDNRGLTSAEANQQKFGIDARRNDQPNDQRSRPERMKDFYHPTDGPMPLTGDSKEAAAGLSEVAKAAKNAAAGLGAVSSSTTSRTQESKAQSGADYNKAEGGEIHGPGTATSDSIIARLSSGEFVMRARAVAQYGVNFMHAINSGLFPGFAMGGLVPSPVRLAGGSGSTAATSVVNLSIDGHTFNGFRGPKNTVDDLTSFAISRQTSAAGRNPNWMK